MPYTDIRKELCPLVYEQLLALANPATGIVQVSSGEIIALLGCGKWKNTQVQTAIRYLEADKKIEVLAIKAQYGQQIRIPELCKGNTVTTQIVGTDKPSQKLEEPAPTQSWPKDPARPKSVDDMFPRVEPKQPIINPEILKELTLADALDEAEKVLSECPELIGKIFSQFLKTRTALTNLVEEVKRNGNGSNTTNS